MMNDKAIIGQIDVPEVNEDLLTSIFNLAPALKDIYQTQNSKAGLPDIVFINADNKNAILKWHEINKQQPNTPIMVTSGNRQIGKALTIQAPINFRKVMLALKMLSSTSSAAVKAKDSTDDSLKIKILVVDDSLPVRKFMQGKLPALLPCTLQLDFAASGEEAAKKIIKQQQYPYDMVFLDVVMPGVDGYKVCKWIKAEYPCRVVMLTSKSSPFDKVRGAMSGCDDYLTKPPDEQRLQKVLYKALRIIQKNNQNKADANG